MKVHMRYDLCSSGSIVLDDIIVHFVVRDIGICSGHDCSSDYWEHATYLACFIWGQIPDFDAMLAWYDQNMTSCQRRDVKESYYVWC